MQQSITNSTLIISQESAMVNSMDYSEYIWVILKSIIVRVKIHSIETWCLTIVSMILFH